MKKILITGAGGFLGRNLLAHLAYRTDYEIKTFGKGDPLPLLAEGLLDADVVYHLAGVNRPKDSVEFESGNVHLTRHICETLALANRAPTIIFSSSSQVALDNKYGASKLVAEKILQEFAAQSGAKLCIFRLGNLFGKWCRPNYNSVTATFCYNIANDLPISISDSKHKLELSYIDDVVAAFVAELDKKSSKHSPRSIPSHTISLGELAGTIQAFHEMRDTLMIPDFANWFNRALYATYLSYVSQGAREYGLNIRSDNRGSLAEFVKQAHFGQIFVSRTHPGITRGNHYHHTKTEKFFVVEGDGLIRMRSIFGGPVQEYRVSGTKYQVVDIPPGITHSITNVGDREMVTLFWSSEVFNPNYSDTYFLSVDFEEQSDPVTNWRMA